MKRPSPELANAYAKALQNGWTEEDVEIETAGANAWECYKAIMNGLSFKDYQRIINTGGSVRYIPQDGKGF